MTKAGQLFIVAAIFLVAFAASGCGESDDRERVRIWHQKEGAERAFFEEAVREYNAQQDDHRIEILYRETEDLRNLFVIASVGGRGPEIIFGPADNVGILAVTETVMPIDEVMPAEYLDQFDEEGLVAWDGSPWMLADQVGNHLAFVYNRDILPEAPETTDEMIDMLGTAMMDPDVTYGLTWNYREPFFFVPFLHGFGGRLMDEDGNPTLNTPETVEAIRFILDLRHEHGLIPRESDYNMAESIFMSHRSASIINGPWAWTGYGRAGIDYEIAPIPRVSETGEWSAPFVAAKGYSVNVNVSDEKMPYVRRVLEHLTDAEMQKRMVDGIATIPVITEVRESDVVRDNPVVQKSMQQAELGIPMPVEPQLRQIWDGMRGPYQLVMNGAVTPERGAQLMQEEVEKRIADAFL